MSRFFSSRYKELEPYVPGEQPKDMQYIKLNTNESPFPPPSGVVDAVCQDASKLNIYSDPECRDLIRSIAKLYDVKEEQVIVSNGSDEVLNFAFMAFASETSPLVFPDITYGFYPVFANLNQLPYKELPLQSDFRIDIEAYKLPDSEISAGYSQSIVIANPNAHTGLSLSLAEIEELLKSNPNGIVIIDEAYVDFGCESAVSLIDDYDNLLVIQTFSKSRSLAGARLGMAFGSEALINDLNTIKYSVNPYNVNRMTCAAGVAAINGNDYFVEKCQDIIENRQYFISELDKLGFKSLPSQANFVLTRSDKISGESLYEELKKRAILVRHFNSERIKDYNRITIGTREQMDSLLNEIKNILLVLNEIGD